MWDDKKLQIFRAKLLNWYDRHRRLLPWRNNPTPYRIWISEIMLQQTQTGSVLRYYDRFMKRFPDLESLAQASEPEVLQFWSGLGYYSRARNIHKAARQMLELHKSFPDSFSAISALPGIGRYTAGAILSIAFNQPYPVVDGNIRRVITRLNGEKGHLTESYFWKTMSAWIPGSTPSRFNQAMMELGALVCVPSRPRCRQCPARSLCRAKEFGLENRIPQVRRKQICKKIRIAVLVLEQNSRILLSKSSNHSFIPGNLELPWRIVQSEAPAVGIATKMCRAILGHEILLQELGQIRHSISNRRITALIFYGRPELQISSLRADESVRWMRIASARKVLTSSLYRKVLAGVNSRIISGLNPA
jgi:A/G-specific adenine glycosylase